MRRYYALLVIAFALTGCASSVFHPTGVPMPQPPLTTTLNTVEGRTASAPATTTTSPGPATITAIVDTSSASSSLMQFTQNDLQAALAIYQAAGDTAGVNCMQAIIAAQPQLSALTNLQVSGAFSAFAAARVRTEALKKGIPENVHIACAPLVVDANTVLLRFHQ